MQGAPWLSHHWSDADRGTMTNCDADTPTQCIHALERGNYAPLVSVEMLHLCLLPWLLRNAGCTAEIRPRDNAFVFKLKVYRLQSEPARWICFLQRLVWPDKKGNQSTVRNRKEAEGEGQTYRVSRDRHSPVPTNPAGRFSWV